MSKVIRVTILSPLSSQVERRLVMLATTSMALASRLPSGLNRVMSPVAAGIATAGQAERVAVMPTSVIWLSGVEQAVTAMGISAARAALDLNTGWESSPLDGTRRIIGTGFRRSKRSRRDPLMAAKPPLTLLIAAPRGFCA